MGEIMKYRLGLDMGSNSLGWCAVKLDAEGAPCGVLDAGVRILTPNQEAGRDPKSLASLAAGRREARAMRRRRDRFLRRQKRLMEILVSAGLMPANEAERKALERLDPYFLRAAAVEERVEAHELGRALFHLNQRRGFKSNRIADSDDNEKGATKQGMRELEAALNQSGARTLGQFLARRHARDRNGARLKQGDGYAKPQAVRFRPEVKGTSVLYDFYPTRDMLEQELDTIWSVQAPHHPQLTPELLTKLKRLMVEQRPLKKPAVGRCTLIPTEKIIAPFGFKIDMGERAPKALPVFQRFRILQDACQLRVSRPGQAERRLTMQEFHVVANMLMSVSKTVVEFAAIRKELKLPDDARFNYELSGRKGFPPDQAAVKLSHKNAFGKSWRTLPRERQMEIVERLLATEEPAELQDWLRDNCELSPEAAEFVSELRLPQGYGQLGRAALEELVHVMETESWVDPETGEIFDRPLTYDEAVRRIEKHHSDLGPKDADRKERLPYYGAAMARHVIAKPDAPEGSQERIGRVPNPTVHIGMNQLRAVVNALIDAYGPPAEIVIELARELKQNKEQKEKIQRENRENEKANDDRRERLAKLAIADTYSARLLLRLFDELPADEKVCVYSGKPLSVEQLFNGSVDIDHILPHKLTLDDSFMNKVLCTREANRRKGRRSPGEAWSDEELQTIVERAERLFPKKAWRFQPDAMAKFQEKGDLAARHLTDTQHMARMARGYLEHVCGQVWASTGKLTSMLRAKWGLNGLLPDHNYADTNQPKNRKDHRHHAIDAFVLACADRGMINRIARASGEAAAMDLDHLFPRGGFPEPYDGFRDDLKKRLDAIVVSHKPDHGLSGIGVRSRSTSGQLHEETAYGPINEEIDGKAYNLVTRKPIAALSEKEIRAVRDASLRAQLIEVAEQAKRDGKKLSEALTAFGAAQEPRIGRVRVLKVDKSARRFTHGNGRFEKAYIPGSNHCIEIFETADGKWRGEGVTTLDANTPGYYTRWRDEYPDARFVMRVQQGDLIEADRGGGRKIYRVSSLWIEQGTIPLAEHNETGDLNARHKDPDDRFSWWYGSYSGLKKAGARRVRVDPIGRVAPVSEVA